MNRLFLALVTVLLISSAAFADDGSLGKRVDKLEKALAAQAEIIKRQEAVIQSLQQGLKPEFKSELKDDKAALINSRLLAEGKDRLVSRIVASASGGVRGNNTGNAAGSTGFQSSPRSQSSMNPSISLNLDTLFYSTNLSDAEIESREIPGYRTLHEEAGSAHAHGEVKEGFNLRSAELAISAPVDPYLKLYTKIPISETDIELEEAYFVTSFLPGGLQLKGGKFKSGFGRSNAFHRHAWDFVDTPLPYLAFFGEEGLIEKGVQVTYMPDLPIYTLLGFELLQGDNEVLFGDGAEDGAHAYAAFVKVSKDFGVSSTVLAGLSVAGGETKTESIEHGSEFAADSTIYGAELTYKWRPSKKRSFKLQTEYLLRRQVGKYLEDAAVPGGVERLTRSQDGLYVQGLYQLGRWRLGARYEILDVFEDDFIKDGIKQKFGESPERITGSLEFNPTEFTRLRLQYNHDEMARTGETNHELYLQLILGIGAHGAHSF
ncbi:hypothetical protein MNBD_DELTA01-104 [hydrothermal vent metagenome]|uniref:Zinc-regulated TonB-dependent outer membrane receptor n=1 Tax=hydrothermal vent metagenome TaxID=652676 RepID=A0A3B0QR43_9ZZZZ